MDGPYALHDKDAGHALLLCLDGFDQAGTLLEELVEPCLRLPRAAPFAREKAQALWGADVRVGEGVEVVLDDFLVYVLVSQRLFVTSGDLEDPAPTALSDYRAAVSAPELLVLPGAELVSCEYGHRAWSFQ